MIEPREAKLLSFSSSTEDYPTDGESIVFVYGTLRSGDRQRGGLLKSLGGERLATECLTRMRMHASSVSAFPFVVVSDDPEDTIIVESWSIPNTAIRTLDGIEGHPLFYRRTYVDAGRSLPTFLYTVPEVDVDDLPVVPDGDWFSISQQRRSA